MLGCFDYTEGTIEKFWESATKGKAQWVSFTAHRRKLFFTSVRRLFIGLAIKDTF